MGTNAPFSTAPRPAIVDNAFSSDQQRGMPTALRLSDHWDSAAHFSESQ